jgi:hypothetical protein
VHHRGYPALAGDIVTVDTGELARRYDRTDARLGRTLHLDARSLAYTIERDREAMAKAPKTVLWDRKIPILDQGNLGSCTGNAGTGALGTAPFWEYAKHAVPADAAGAERYAVQLYADATRADVWPGAYPPDDTGSSGLAVCKVLRKRGVIAGYRWATSVHGLAMLLQNGPVLLGMPWHEAFFSPDGHGFIDRAGWQESPVAGGHEVEIVGINVDTRILTVCNSWGTRWGDHGRFRMHVETYTRLHGCDVKQYVI